MGKAFRLVEAFLWVVLCLSYTTMCLPSFLYLARAPDNSVR